MAEYDPDQRYYPLTQSGLPIGRLNLMAKEIRAAADAVGATVLHVTHDPSGIAADFDRIGVIEDGRLVQLGTAMELQNSPSTPFVLKSP